MAEPRAQNCSVLMASMLRVALEVSSHATAPVRRSVIPTSFGTLHVRERARIAKARATGAAALKFPLPDCDAMIEQLPAPIT